MLRGLHILVVDDTPDVLMVLARVLTSYGATVAVASSAEEALARLEEQPPDVLLSDLSMPGQSGLDLIRIIRGRAGGSARQLPAAAVSALPVETAADEALSAGFQAHLSKPVHVRTLVETVLRLASTA